MRSNCPLSCSLDIIGDKWSLIIIRDLFIGRKTYTEFLDAPEKISSNILVTRLKSLREFGVIDFVKDKKRKNIKYYFLTVMGKDLYPIITDLSLWYKKYNDIEFHPLSKLVFKEISEIGRLEHINNSLKSYDNSLKKMFN